MTDPASRREAVDPASLRCDTCGCLTPIVSRVVVDDGYNRANSRAVYNCPACYEKKNRERHPSG